MDHFSSDFSFLPVFLNIPIYFINSNRHRLSVFFQEFLRNCQVEWALPSFMTVLEAGKTLWWFRGSMLGGLERRPEWTFQENDSVICYSCVRLSSRLLCWVVHMAISIACWCCGFGTSQRCGFLSRHGMIGYASWSETTDRQSNNLIVVRLRSCSLTASGPLVTSL